jgi:DNA-binding GntR family transcriptional regulator
MLKNARKRGRPPSQGAGVFPSLPAAVAAEVRGRILNGTLKPGDRIVESGLGKELLCGQPAVREALLVLERERLVTRVSSLGTFVTKLDAAAVRDLSQLRSLLDGFAAERAARRVTRDEVEELREFVARMEVCSRGSDRWSFLEADLAFHRRIYELSGNHELPELFDILVKPLFVYYYTRFPEWHPNQRTTDSHREIVDAIASDPEAARAMAAQFALSSMGTE